MDCIAGVAAVVILLYGCGRTIKRGKIRITRHRVVEGIRARIIGVLLLVTLPVGCAGLRLGSAGDNDLASQLLAVSLALICPLAAVIIGFASAKRVESEPPRAQRVPTEFRLSC